MNINEEYYIPMRYGEPNAPLLSWDNDKNYIEDEEPVELIEPLSLKLADPLTSRVCMVDYHRLQNNAVFSEEIKDILGKLNIYNTQLLPAKVKINSEITLDYYHLHIYNLIPEVIDYENSEYEGEEDDIDYMSKIMLNPNKITEIPLEKRLVFKLEEFPFREIFHKSIVDKIMEVEPLGVAFWPLNLWHDLAYGSIKPEEN